MLQGVALLLVGAGVLWGVRQQSANQAPPQAVNGGSSQAQSIDPAQAAFRDRSSGMMLQVSGAVERNLPDDRDGSPHQRFIIRTNGGISLLIVHNLDLAPRLDGLSPGHSVTVLGEYEWNDRGGLIHWTHDDPQGRHAAGYVEWQGRRYQ